jgi:hypothetical protein
MDIGEIEKVWEIDTAPEVEPLQVPDPREVPVEPSGEPVEVRRDVLLNADHE